MRCTRHTRLWCPATECVAERTKKKSSSSSHSSHSGYDPTLDITMLTSTYDSGTGSCDTGSGSTSCD